MKYITAQECAKRIGYSSSCVCKFAREGKFGSVKVTKGRWMFSEDNVEHFIKKMSPGEKANARKRKKDASAMDTAKFAYDAQPFTSIKPENQPSSEAILEYIETAPVVVEKEPGEVFVFKNDDTAAKVARLCKITGLTAETLISKALELLVESKKVRDLIEAYEMFEAERKGFEL